MSLLDISKIVKETVLSHSGEIRCFLNEFAELRPMLSQVLQRSEKESSGPFSSVFTVVLKETLVSGVLTKHAFWLPQIPQESLPEVVLDARRRRLITFWVILFISRHRALRGMLSNWFEFGYEDSDVLRKSRQS